MVYRVGDVLLDLRDGWGVSQNPSRLNKDMELDKLIK
jgi:hypothetical protein